MSIPGVSSGVGKQVHDRRRLPTQADADDEAATAVSSVLRDQEFDVRIYPGPTLHVGFGMAVI